MDSLTSSSSKVARQYLSEISELERLYVKLCDSRLELIEQIKEIQKQETEAQLKIELKKSEFRNFIESQNASKSGSGSHQKDQMTSEERKKRILDKQQQRSLRMNASTRKALSSFENEFHEESNKTNNQAPKSPISKTGSFENEQQKTISSTSSRGSIEDSDNIHFQFPSFADKIPLSLEVKPPKKQSSTNNNNQIPLSTSPTSVVPLAKSNSGGWVKVTSPRSSALASSRSSSFGMLGIHGEALCRVFGPQLTRLKDGSLSSVENPPLDTASQYVAAQSISTYPVTAQGDKRDGDPLCDHYFIELYPNRLLVALADGCNWGLRPYNAALKAVEGFIQYLRTSKINTLDESSKILIRAIWHAHYKIVEGLPDIWEAGTSTLLGGMLLKLKKSENLSFRWVFVCVTVGDCKAFHWSHKTKKVIDITEGNRTNLYDAKDPGGRLGPYGTEGSPDMRNLELFIKPCEENDILVLVSDGVHDNYDPQHLGKLPTAFNIHSSSWEEATKAAPEDVEDAKNQFRCQLLETQISDLDSQNKLSPPEICKLLLEYCRNITTSSRQFLTENPHKRLPTNFEDYPGKVDHTTAITITVPSSKFQLNS